MLGSTFRQPASSSSLSSMAMEIGQEAEIERLENNFFDRYWPGTGDGNSTAASLADLEDPNVEDAGKHRASKTARLQESKGERGKGNAAYGSYGKRREREYSTGSQAWRRQQTAWDEWTEEASSSKSVKALQEEIKIMQDKVFSLQKMALRHEDFSTCLKSELSWVMFMKVDMRASVVPCLYQMQQKWRELKENHPEKLKTPKRVDLVRSLFKEFGSRINHLANQDEQMQDLIKMGWLKKDPLRWNYVQWNPDAGRLQPIPDREAVPFEKVAAVVASMQHLAESGAISRFHPSRDLEEKMGGKILTFSLQIIIHGQAAEDIRGHLDLLSQLAATQLLGLSMRRERPNRSALANQIQRQIG